ncbi:MAG TPA: hypothetical protein VFZ25_19200 [Chloroflexota bacterium]|nr:hypothetical protein [Chloroflexota bacterium]
MTATVRASKADGTNHAVAPRQALSADAPSLDEHAGLREPPIGLRQAHLAPPTLSPSAVLALQRALGNHTVGRVLGREQPQPIQRDANLGGRLIQRVINVQLNHAPLRQLLGQQGDNLTYQHQLTGMADTALAVRKAVTRYNRLDPALQRDKAKKELTAINDGLGSLQSDLNWLIKGLAERQNQSAADAETYRVLVGFQTSVTDLSRAANAETAQFFNIVRAGPGGRSDANTADALERSLPRLGLGGAEMGQITAFLQNQGQTWKEKREALSMIWAKRAGQFANLDPGKGNQYGADVEYKTRDQGKPQLWDQKTIYSDATPFDGRIAHTHQKNTDANGRGVGLLFDSTFENDTNYEKAWLTINAAVLSGEIAPDAVREVRAPNPGALQSDIYVEMARNYPNGGVEANVKWAENNLAHQQQNGLEVIASGTLGGTNYASIVNHTANSHSRYTNDRNWLPPGVYDEYAVGGLLPNEGKGRFVATEDLSRIYLSVTHYKAYTVKLANQTVVNRNPFFRIV